MKRLPATHTQRIRIPNSSSASREQHSCAGRRGVLPRWGDLHPNHRIPTFLESVYFEGDASATLVERYDT